MTDERPRSFLAERLAARLSEPPEDEGDDETERPWFTTALTRLRGLGPPTDNQPPDAA